MKKLLVLGLLASMGLSAIGQGIVYFNNRVTGVVDAKIYVDTVGSALLPGGTAGVDFRAALLGGAQGSTASSMAGIGTLALLANPAGTATWVNFRTGAAAGYVGNTDPARNSGLPYGSTGMFQVVAWQGNYANWAEAYAAGMAGLTKIGWSNPVTVTTTASATDPSTPYLVGLQPFAIALVPEPSSMALLGLGAAAMMLFRRRN